MSDHHHMIYTILKTKFEKFELKKLIYHNFKQLDSNQFKLDICNGMSAVRTQTAFGNHFVSILINVLLRKQKFYEGIKNPILIRTLGSKQ